MPLPDQLPGIGAAFLAHSPGDNAQRCEWKFVVDRQWEASANVAIMRRLPMLARHHPSRVISSLYFDTPSFACYEQSNAGITRRIKLRLRWYGELNGATRPVLELKHRENYFGWKEVHEVGTLDIRGMTWQGLRAELSARLGDRARQDMDRFSEPAIVTRYRRHYFHVPSIGVRVTVDTNLQFFDQRLRNRLNLTFDSVAFAGTLVEAKVDRSRRAEGVQLMQGLGIRPTRFSKYCSGLARLRREA